MLGNNPHGLTDAEMENLQVLVLAPGSTNKAIAYERGVSHRTVANQLYSTFEKLNVANRTEAVALAEKQGWFRPEQEIEEELAYDDILLNLDVVRQLRKGNDLKLGIKFAQRITSQLDMVIKEHSKTDLLGLYFDALFELIEYHMFITPAKNLLKEVNPSFQKMHDIYDQTKAPELCSRLTALRGDMMHVLALEQLVPYKTAYRELQRAKQLARDPTQLLYYVLRSMVLVLGESGTEREFEAEMATAEHILDRFCTDAQDTTLASVLEGMSRAYAVQFHRSGVGRHRKLAIAKLEESKRVFATAHKKGHTFEGLELRVPRARLRLAQLRVIDLDLDEQICLAKEVHDRAANVGDLRVATEMERWLTSIYSTRRISDSTLHRL